MMRFATAAAATACLVAANLAPAAAASLVALTSDGALVRIEPESRQASAPVKLRAEQGRVVAIDVRPADMKLYGLTDTGRIVRIDPASGGVEVVSTLDKPVEAGARVAVNFNPTVDRLRVVGVNGANYRINVDTGAVTVDGGLKYAPGTELSGTQPMVTAASYTNSFAGSKETMMYTIDAMLSQLNLQAPPNDGVQQVKGATGVKLPPGIGFDILADGAGGNTGYVVAAGALHMIDLASGRVTTAGPVARLPADVLSLAAMR